MADIRTCGIWCMALLKSALMWVLVSIIPLHLVRELPFMLREGTIKTL